MKKSKLTYNNFYYYLLLVLPLLIIYVMFCDPGASEHVLQLIQTLTG